jgi:hypothetical protein
MQTMSKDKKSLCHSEFLSFIPIAYLCAEHLVDGLSELLDM